MEASDELHQSVAFLSWEADAEAVVKCGYIAAVSVFAGLAPIVSFLIPSGRHQIAGLLGVSVVALLVADGIHRLPHLLATARRTAALGETPALVSRAVLRMRLDPTAESAAVFAAETSDGPLGASLAAHVRTARGTGRSGFETFATEWDEWYPSLRRALSLVGAAAQAPAGERARTLDRALDAVLSGTRERTESFVEQIRGPTTALYAFGVLLPLALVAVLPAATAAGLPVTTPVFIVLYDLLLPTALLAVSARLLVRRPMVFPPGHVSSDHPSLPPWRRWAPVVGSGVGVLAYALTTLFGQSWGASLVAIGAGVGSTLIVWFHPVTQIQTRIRAVEDGLADALYLVGQRVQTGTAVDAALVDVGEELGGETSDVFTAAARTQRVLKTDLKSAFCGPHGALSTLPSPRVESAATLLALAATEGRPAGHAIVSMADHLDDLQQVEAHARRSLRQVTDTLRQTGLIFAPLVGGTTVALATSLTGTNSKLASQALAFDTLGAAIGVYVLILAVLLTTLSVGLEAGLNRAQVGYHVGIALVVAPTVFLATVEVTAHLT